MLTMEAPKLADLGELLQFFGVVIFCAGVLNLVYRWTSPNKTDDSEFASTIFILTIAIGLLVSIIKHAPAISFGLFGAMSIVRFRAQIKRPQRMIFVFMAAAIGVCCGAGEYMTTVLGTLVLSVLSLASFRVSAAKTKTVPDAAAASAAVAKRAWGIDFVPAQLEDGRRIRVLGIVDEGNKEALAVIPDSSFSGARVTAELDRLIAERGKPDTLVSDSWPEFGSRTVLDWKQKQGIDWQCLELSTRPQPEPFVVAFGQLLRDDCLNARGIANLIEARILLEIWRATYNGRVSAAHEWRPSASKGEQSASPAPTPAPDAPKQPVLQSLPVLPAAVAALVAVPAGQPPLTCSAAKEKSAEPPRTDANNGLRPPALSQTLVPAGE